MILFIWCVSLPCVHTHTPWTIRKKLCLCLCVVLGLHLRESYICMLVLSLPFPQPSPLPSRPQLLSGFQFMVCFFFSLHLGCSIVQVLSCALCFASCPSHFFFQHPETHSYVQTSLNLSSWIVYALFNLVFGEWDLGTMIWFLGAWDGFLLLFFFSVPLSFNHLCFHVQIFLLPNLSIWFFVTLSTHFLVNGICVPCTFGRTVCLIG